MSELLPTAFDRVTLGDDKDKNETPYIETEALLAVMDDDSDHACELLTQLSDREIRAFEAYVHDLQLLVRDIMWKRWV